MEREDEGGNNLRDSIEEHNMQGDGVFYKKCRGKQKKKKKREKNKAEGKQGEGEEQMKGRAEKIT